MLYGLLVFDSSSGRLGRYFRRAIHEFDRAGGSHVDIIGFGNPAKSGRVHQHLRNQELREQDAQGEALWARLRSEGRAGFHRMAQLSEAEERFNLTSEDIPCILFFRSGDIEPVGRLGVSLAWFKSDMAWRVFNRCFREWLRRADLVHLATADLQRSEVETRLISMLVKLTAEVNRSVRAGQPGVCPNRSIRPRVPRSFQVPPGTQWGNIALRVDDLKVTVTAGSSRHEYDFRTAGFEDGRRRKIPDSIWGILKVLAGSSGAISVPKTEVGRRTRALSQRISELRNRLRVLIPGVHGDPVPFEKGRRCYQAAFRISSGTGPTISVPAGTRWHDVSMELIRPDAIRLSYPVTKRFATPTFSEELGRKSRRLDAAQRECEEAQVHDLRSLGLADEGGRKNPAGSALVRVLKGNGSAKRPERDPGMLSLCEILTKLIPIDEPAFDFSMKEEEWFARFNAAVS